MMTILRIIIGTAALVLVFTMAFGQELNQMQEPSGEELFYPVIGGEEGGFSPQAPVAPVESVPFNKGGGAPQGVTFSVDDLKRVSDKPKSTIETIPVSQAPQGVTPQHEVDSNQAELLAKEEEAFLAAQREMSSGTDIPIAQSRSPLEIEGYGILSLESGGFGELLWQGVSQKQALEFIRKFEKTGVKSRTAERMMRNLLLTSAIPPIGGDGKNWLVERVSSLHSLGMAFNANLLLSGSGVLSSGVEKVEGLPSVWVENTLMMGQTEEACNYVRQHLLNSDDVFWRHALLTCQAIQDDVAGLQLSLNVASEEEKSSAPMLYKILTALVERADGPILAPDDRFNPLEATLYGNFTHLLTPAVILRLPDAILRKISKDESLSMTLRLQAAEKLVNDYNTEEDVMLLSRLYDQATFEDGLVASPNVAAAANKELDGSMARAMLWQGAKSSALPSTRSMNLKAFWDRAEKEDLDRVPAIMSPDLRGIKPEANLAWFAPYAIVAFLKDGDFENATSWWNQIKQNKSLSRDLQEKRSHLAVAFALIEGKIDEDILDSWWQQQSIKTQQGKLHVQRVLALLEAQNITIPASIWHQMSEGFSDAVSDQGKGPGPLWLRMVGSGLEANRYGEVISLLLEPLMSIKPEEMSPDGIANIVTALQFMERYDEAKSLALEAILTMGD